MRSRLRHLRIILPHWLPVLYLVVAIILVPWIEVMSYTLPVKHVSEHWDVMWGGFDVGILITVALTAYFAFKKSGWVSLTAMSVFTLLVADAWFDILSSRPGQQTVLAIGTAIFVELPLAGLSLWLAHNVTHKLIKASHND